MNLHKNMKLFVGVCYRSPSSSEENNRELAELISKALNALFEILLKNEQAQRYF